MTFRPGWAAAALALFTVEGMIALFVHDAFVRPYLGDSLAVALVHCSLRAVTRLRPMHAALAAFGIAALIELGQLVGILHLIGLEHSRLARIVLGSGYDPRDFLAYAAGAVAMLAVERAYLKR
ncbi:MAG: DUF2809 domain-containing protein [Pseudomonadota bacterium]